MMTSAGEIAGVVVVELVAVQKKTIAVEKWAISDLRSKSSVVDVAVVAAEVHWDV